MNRFIKAHLGVMKSKIIQGIWYETKGSPSYHVLFQKMPRSHSSLSHRMPLDLTNDATNLDTGAERELFHLTANKRQVFNTVD